MCTRFLFLLLIIALTIETTAGVNCYNCNLSTSRECLSPESFSVRKTLVTRNCAGKCVVLLGQYGRMGVYTGTLGLRRGCETQVRECKNKNMLCCWCKSNFCNENNFCGGTAALSGTILSVINGLFIILYEYCMLDGN